MEEEVKKTEYKDIYELEQECIRLTTYLKKRGSYKGFKDTLTKLYTKSGHFVFELIQNAEDCDAEEIIFALQKDELIFQHDGKKLFTLDNVDAITNVGNSTKNDNENNIGKFGVGFKSVFEYTNTPEVHSGNYHFIIKDMYIPHPIGNSEFCSNTVFHLPFDISGKPKENCFNEISETLKNLNPETLLFLSHIKKIVCRINSEEWILQRKDTALNGPKNLCTLSKNKVGTMTSTNTNYIRFFDTIRVTVSEKDENDEVKECEKEIKVGIAFKAECNDASAWSIKPIIYNNTPAGKVFTFFPCEAEKSGLCFHIHAPFALTVDREKLRNDSGNEVIKNRIVDLLHSHLAELRDENLLNMDFLKTLPNKDDDLGTNQNNSSNYEMFKKVFDFFDNEPFTPMENGSYEPAKDKLRSKNRIGTLFPDEDMNKLYGTEGKAYWIKNPRQVNQRDDKFIQSLSCKDYNLNNFIDDYSKETKKYDEIKELLKNKNFVAHEGIKKIVDRYNNISEIFAAKEWDWFCKFYAQLESMISSRDDWEHNWYYRCIKDYPFCFCSDSKLYNFSQCYIPSRNLQDSSENIHFLNSKICEETSKNNNLKDFLYSIGLKEYSEKEIFKIEFQTFLNGKTTIEKFIEIFKKYRKLSNGLDSLNSDFYDLYKNTKFLISNDGGVYAPCEIYLTQNYGLRIKNVDLYFSSLRNPPLKGLSDDYLPLLDKDELDCFVKFLTYFGCRNSVDIYQTRCSENRYWHDIYMNAEGYGGGNSLSTSIDFNVAELDIFLSKITFDKFEFVWSFLQHTTITQKTNCYYERDTSYCYYKTAQKYNLEQYPSELRNILVETKWVAQEENGSTKFVTPAKAYISKLPEYYKNQFTNELNCNLSNWFNRLDFGKEEKESEAKYQQKLEEERKQKEELNKLSQRFEVSLETLSELTQAKKEGLLTDDDIKNFISGKRKAKQDREEFENSNVTESNKERIFEKTKQRFMDADDISSEKKMRTVRTTNAGIKDSTKLKLRSRYTSLLNGNMRCQLCQQPMPFKDRQNQDYFVVRQLFSSKIFEKEIDENYIALCPTCDAKFKVYFEHDIEQQNDLVERIKKDVYSTEFKIMLDNEYELYFRDDHIIALRACLGGIYEDENPKKAVILVRKKNVDNDVKLEKEAFCIICKKTFRYMLNKPVVSCSSCHSSYKNLKGVITLLNAQKQKNTFISFEQLKQAIELTKKEDDGFVFVSNLAKSLKTILGTDIPGKMRNIISNYADKLVISEKPAFEVKLK